jgi:peptidyl-prolyl cis-trans isomerase D
VRRLGLGLDDAEIANSITKDPTFRGLTGQFDRNRFQQIIRQAGYTEARFVALQRQSVLRRHLAETVAGQPQVPTTGIEALNRFGNEERAIDYIALDAAAAGDIPPPTPEQLAKYFDEHKARFRAPEYRKLVVLVLTPEDQARWIEVSDADAKQTFETHRDRYFTPEKRHVQQILFANEAAARAASERIAKGTTFDDLAKEPEVKERFADLGTVARKAMLDPAIAEAAFKLQPNEVSAPIKGRFGTVLARVLKVEPEVSRSYEQVAPEIKRQLALERAKAQLLKSYDKIEDERAGGRNLAEVAQKLNLKVQTFDNVDRAGNGPDGKPVAGLPKFADIVSSAFVSDVGVENDPLQTGGNYAWYEVAGIAPSRERRLDEVKTAVEARWRDDEIAKRLKAKADAMVEKLKTGGKIAELATGGLKLESATGLKRGKPSEAIPANAIQAIFRTPKDGAGSAEGDKATTRLLFVVKDVSVPRLDMAAADTKALISALRQQLSDELLSQYVASLESEIGVSINQAALNQAIGVTSN